MHFHVLGSLHHVHNKNSGLPLYVLQAPCMIVSLNCCLNACWLTACVLGTIIASDLSNVLTWKKKFLVSTLVMGANLLLFMSGFTFYDHEKPTKSSFIDIFEVLRAAISKTKRHINYPNEPTQYHWENHTPISKLHDMNDSGQVLLLPKYQIFR